MEKISVTDHSTLLRPRARLRPFGYAVALAIVLSAAAVGREAYSEQKEAANFSRLNDQLLRRQAAVNAQPSPPDLERQRQWAVLKQDRAFPWAKVFRAVEHVADPDIELLEFRPDRRQGALLLKGEGRTAESVMRYLERLQEDPTFSRVYLAHAASVERGRLQTRSFELRLRLDSSQFSLP